MVSTTVSRSKKAPTTVAPLKITKVESVASMSTDVSGKSPRKHITAVLGIYTSHARIDKYLKGSMNVPSDIGRCKEIKTALSNKNTDEFENLFKDITKLKKDIKPEMTAAEKNAVNKKVDAKLKTLSADAKANYEMFVEQKDIIKRIIRLSKEVPIAIAIVSDFIIRDLITFGIERALTKNDKSDKKRASTTVNLSHLFEEGYDNTKVYPMISTLKTFEKYVKTPELLKKAKKLTEEETGSDAKSDDDTSSSEEGDNINFKRYIQKFIKEDIRNDPKYNTIRVSNYVKEFLSNLIVDLLERISMYSKIIVHNIAGARTLNTDYLINIIKLFMSHRDPGFVVFNDISSIIQDKLKKNQDYHKSKLKKDVVIP